MAFLRIVVFLILALVAFLVGMLSCDNSDLSQREQDQSLKENRQIEVVRQSNDRLSKQNQTLRKQTQVLERENDNLKKASKEAQKGPLMVTFLAESVKGRVTILKRDVLQKSLKKKKNSVKFLTPNFQAEVGGSRIYVSQPYHAFEPKALGTVVTADGKKHTNVPKKNLVHPLSSEDSSEHLLVVEESGRCDLKLVKRVPLTPEFYYKQFPRP